MPTPFRIPTGQLLIVLFVLGGAPAPAAAEVCEVPQFAAARTLATGGSVARGVDGGDFNRDGLPDLVVANGITNLVSVFLATEPGLYAPVVNYEVGPSVSDAVVGDFNGDNLLDIAAVSTGNYSVLPGNGDGTFGEPIHTPATSAGGFGKLAVGDFNRDGKPDLAHKSSGLRVLTGNGDGTFAVSANVDSPNPNGNFVAVEDLNHDGFQDLVTANGGLSGVVRVILGNGDGTFRLPASVAVPSSPVGVAIGDFNQDGKPDLVSVNNGAGNISVLLGDGQGAFNNVTNIPTATSPQRVVVGDFSGNGHLDIAVASGTGNAVTIILGAGDGSFAEVIQHEVLNPGALHTMDIDLDGIVDLVVGTTSGFHPYTLWLMHGLGDGRFWGGPPTYSTGGGAKSLAIADFNGDEQPDLVVMNGGSSALAVLLNQGDGSFLPGGPITFASNPQAVTAADFNGDGHADLAALGTLAMYVAFGNGDGTFETPVNIVPAGGFFASAARDAVATDVDGNGHPDILIAGSTLQGIGLTVFRSNGDNTFQAPAAFASAGLGDPLVVTDFNGDTFPDVVMANQSTNRFSLFRGNGNGTFQTPLTYEMGTNVYAITAADFNGDGHADVAVANYGCYSCGAGAADGGVAVRLGVGDGTFLDPVHYAVTQRPEFITSGDFNGDGVPDLAVTDLLIARVTFLLGNGDGTFRVSLGYGLPGSSERSVVADFNGDGKLDLAAAVFGKQAVAMFLNVCEAAPPVFSFTAQPGQLRLTWPAVEGFELQATDDLGSTGWDADIPTPQLNDNQLEVTIPFDAPRRFFRLQRP